MMLLANSSNDFRKVSGRVVSGEFIDHSTIHHSPIITGSLDFANRVIHVMLFQDCSGK